MLLLQANPASAGFFARQAAMLFWLKPALGARMKSLMPIVLLFAACAGTPDSAASQATTPETRPMNPASQAVIRAKGRIVYQDLEGGFWGIVADDGRKFDPIALDEKFHKDGLRVVFEAVPDTDRMSTRMWGTMVVLRKIELE
jgi:hypothetical protein